MDTSKLIIRGYRPGDCPAIVRLFYNTVHSVNARDYSTEQLAAWAPAPPEVSEWDRSFRGRTALIAELSGTLAGFGDIDQDGYLDRLYVHKDFQGMGIASALCDRLEAAVSGHTVTTYVSITARPFFEGRGYRVLRENRVERRGVVLINYLMQKDINII